MLIGFWNQLKKQLKKKLRLKRKRWLNLAVILLVLGMAAVLVWYNRGLSGATNVPAAKDMTVFGRHITENVQPEEEVVKLANGVAGQREAYLKKAYVCGEELQLVGMMGSAEIIAYYKTHPALLVSIGDGGKVYFTENIDDLSPKCKDNAYFSLDSKGNLSLFEGVPGTGGASVIRTFFQLNIEHLKSSLPIDTVTQLYQGIPVKDLADYYSVLSTLSDYAVEETEKVMQPSPGH